MRAEEQLTGGSVTKTMFVCTLTDGTKVVRYACYITVHWQGKHVMSQFTDKVSMLYHSLLTR